MATLATIALTATIANADVPHCPTQLRPPPAAVTFGPYLVTGYATPDAHAYGLPNCDAAIDIANTLLSAVGDGFAITIVAVPDGTYTVAVTRAPDQG